MLDTFHSHSKPEKDKKSLNHIHEPYKFDLEANSIINYIKQIIKTHIIKVILELKIISN